MNFHETVISIIKKVPEGKVATYGQIAFLAGSSGAARQVSWILHSCSKKENLPWHRVINSRGSISLKHGYGYELQKTLLENEKIIFDEKDFIDLNLYLWKPDSVK